jgi:hypothetical protein
MSMSLMRGQCTGRTVPLVTVETQWLAFILLVAAMLRLAGLDWQPFWDDEAATAGFASLPWSELVNGVGRLEPNPAGFYGLEKLWMAIAGGSDFALRLPAAACGIAGVAVVWALARVASGPRAAIWASALAATNVMLLVYSREARVYSLLFLTVGLVALLGRRIAVTAAGPTPWRTVLALAALSALSFWLHYTAVITMVVAYSYAGVIAIHRPGPRLRRLTMLAMAGAAGLMFGLPSLLRMMAIAADKTNNASRIPVPDSFMAATFTISAWTSSYEGAIRLLPATVAVAALAVGLTLVVYVLAWTTTRIRRSADLTALLTAAVLAIVLMAGVSQFVPVMVERTLLFTLLFFLPLAGSALAALPLARVPALLLPLLLLQASGIPALYDGALRGQDWAGATKALEAARVDTAVVTRSAFDTIALERYMTVQAPMPTSVVVTTTRGSALNNGIALRLTHAVPIAETAPPTSLCALLGQHEQVMLFDHTNGLDDRERERVMSLLRAAGGEDTGDTHTGRLIIQRWQHVCAAPSAPAGVRAAALSPQPLPSAGN